MLKNRLLCLLCAMVISLASAFVPMPALAGKAKSTKNAKPVERYAALVVDVDSGKIIYSRNGQDKRYPASLTKMMTLYLLFDAVKHGKLKMKQEMTASVKAAGQPSTNLSLSPGDKITVEKAIQALIVRSANDAAMIVAETLGKTQWNFAVMMNRKARELGMRNTVFRNPSGLPDPGQYTTAVDLAKLAIALRRDFPEYYHYFSLREFDFAGRTYTTHNRVMLRYSGTDGLKTGYINASGFNLVTSVKRNGYNVVAVVMGGRTSSSRDNEMISLLDRSFVQLAKSRSDNKQYARLEVKNPKISRQEEAGGSPEQIANLSPAAGELQGEGDKGELIENKVVQPKPMIVADAPFKRREMSTQEVSEALDWGVQVGVYGSREQAKTALRRARQSAGDFLAESKEGIVPAPASKGRTLHRARLVNLSRDEADNVCRMMEKSPGGCLVIRVKKAGKTGAGV